MACARPCSLSRGAGNGLMTWVKSMASRSAPNAREFSAPAGWPEANQKQGSEETMEQQLPPERPPPESEHFARDESLVTHSHLPEPPTVALGRAFAWKMIVARAAV